jgi:RHS repeat-associated protein
VKKEENGTTTYYLRSAALGGQIVAELNSSGIMTRGFVYQGGQLLAVQQNNQVSWVHQDPFAKSKRVTNSSGNVVSTVELDPWGGDTTRSSNSGFQPRLFTTYDRDGNQSDEAMHRRYNRWHARFDQPDPYGGSHDLSDPQSFNRYAYTQNDPVNFSDPTGLEECGGGDWCYIFGPPNGIPVGGILGDDTGIVTVAPGDQDPVPTGGGTLPGPTPHDPFDGPKDPTDCAILQNTTAVFASRDQGATATVAALRSRFVEPIGQPPTQEFRSSGFRREFRDFGSSPNQVRHYAGILWTAYAAGTTAYIGQIPFAAASAAALAAANARERGGTQSNRVDMNLNTVVVGHAIRLAYGRLSVDNLAKAIFDDVCDPKTVW